MNSLEKRFTWWEWGIEGNYVWCLVVIVIFMELGGANRWGRCFKIVTASHKGWTCFYGRGFSLYNNDILKL